MIEFMCVYWMNLWFPERLGPVSNAKKKQQKKHHTVKQLLTKKEKTSYLNSKYWYSLYIYIFKKKNISIYRLSMYIYSLAPQTWICHNSYCRNNKLHLSISSVLVASAVVIKFAVQAQAGDEIHIKLVQALPLLVETWSLIIIHISSERCDYVLSQVLSQVCWNMIQEIVLSQKPQVLSQVCWSSCTKNLLLKSTAVPRSTRVSVTWLLHDLWLSGTEKILRCGSVQ